MKGQGSESIGMQVLLDPVVQLAAMCSLCALAALSPAAALASLSPTLRLFNPAINPRAALLAFWWPRKQAENRVKARLTERIVRLRYHLH